MANPKKYELYVEGHNDQCIIASIGYQKGLKPYKKGYVLRFGENDVEIKDNNKGQNGNDDKAYEMLQNALTAPQQYGAIALVVDADDFTSKRAQDRLTKFIKIIEDASDGNKIYDTNVSLKNEGIILIPTNKFAEIFPKVGLWIMPDNQNTGAIEHFLWQSGVNQGYINTYKTVEKVIEKYKNDKSTTPPIMHYISNHHHKALVHTFLAWVEDPGNPMGTSVDRKCWNINSDLVNNFLNWLNSVYS